MKSARHRMKSTGGRRFRRLQLRIDLSLEQLFECQVARNLNADQRAG
jgi:hypothetical protein